MHIEKWFPTIIGFDFYPNHQKYQNYFIDRAYEIEKSVEKGGEGWLSNNLYNTADGQYNILNDGMFNNLNKWVMQSVTKFVDDCGLGVTLKPKESWINIYKKGDFQEYHNHPDSFISAIYIIDSPIEDASKIYFQSPLLEQVTVPYIKFENKPTGHIEYQSQPGKLLIFRSYINHCVTQHLSDKNRISIAYNFYKI